MQRRSETKGQRTEEEVIGRQEGDETQLSLFPQTKRRKTGRLLRTRLTKGNKYLNADEKPWKRTEGQRTGSGEREMGRKRNTIIINYKKNIRKIKRKLGD